MPALRPYPWLTGLSWLILGWLWLWPLLMPMLALAAVMVAVAVLDVPSHLPPLLWSSLLLLVGLLELVLGVQLIRRFRLPDWRQTARFIEQENGVAHQPLSGCADTPAGTDDPETLSLWQAHRQRLLQATPLHVPWVPASPVAALDPYGLRVGAWLLLIVALVLEGGHALPRLHQALTLSHPLAPDGVEVWVTPPPHTRLATKSFGNDGQPQAVPDKSRLLVLVKGSFGQPWVEINGQSTALEPRGGTSYGLEMPYEGGERLRVTLFGLPVAAWPLARLEDRPPLVWLSEAPQVSPQGRLAVRVESQDDYGVRQVGLEIEGQSSQWPLPRPQNGLSVGHLDLTAHPLAGNHVSMRPYALDEAGQRAVGPAFSLRLPEREFRHPLARSLIALRRTLLRQPDSRLHVAEELDALTQDSMLSDQAPLALMSAMIQSILLNPHGTLAEAVEFLWTMALKLEEGDANTTRQRMEDSRAALQQALDQGADRAVIRQKLVEYAAALYQLVSQLTAQVGSSADLQGEDWLEYLDGLAQMGSAGQLQQGLDALEQWLDNLQSGLQQAGKVQDLFRKQKEIRDQLTEDAPLPPLAEHQTQLNRLLADLLADSNHIPDALAETAEAMADALQALRHQDRAAAQQAQDRALAALGHLQRQWSRPVPMGGMGGGLGGKGVGASGGNGSLAIPESGLPGDARHILDELRRRSADGQRPAAERDYLLRLLKVF